MVRLATFNLLHGVPVLAGMPQPSPGATGPTLALPDVDDDAPFRAAIRSLDADVLAMQEVDAFQPRSGGADQTAVAAAELEAEHWLFAPSVLGTPGVDGWRPAHEEHEHGAHREGPSTPLYGVSLVSRLPVREWRTTRFEPAPMSLPLLVPAQPRPRFVSVEDEPRAAIAAVVEGPRGPFTVATAHLSFVPGYNVRQLRALRRWLAGAPRPLVVLGDLNLPGRVPRWTTGWTPLLRRPTYPSMRPRVQFDHVLADGLTGAQLASCRADVRPLGVSDHAAVTVDVDL